MSNSVSDYLRFRRRMSCLTAWTAAGLVAVSMAANAQAPRIIHVVSSLDTGVQVAEESPKRQYYIDRGLESNLAKGDTLNVYREKRLSRQVAKPLRIFVGTLILMEVQQGSALGVFEPNLSIMNSPLIRYKVGMKGDIVVPRIVIDSSVLFDPGSNNLKAGAAQEFDKVAQFMQLYSPSKLFIDGHTDSDGDARSNQDLSKKRAELVRTLLIDTYAFITPAMIEARGYGEERPIANNDTPENKALNRRIEVMVWQ